MFDLAFGDILRLTHFTHTYEDGTSAVTYRADPPRTPKDCKNVFVAVLLGRCMRHPEKGKERTEDMTEEAILRMFNAQAMYAEGQLEKFMLDPKHPVGKIFKKAVAKQNRRKKNDGRKRKAPDAARAKRP